MKEKKITPDSLINVKTFRRPEKSGGGKHLLRTGGSCCVKVSFTRVPSSFPLKERHRHCPTELYAHRNKTFDILPEPLNQKKGGGLLSPEVVGGVPFVPFFFLQ